MPSSIEDAYNFRRINDRVTTSGLVNEAQLVDLRDRGYQAVVDLLPHSNDHALADEARIVAELGLDYVYLPVDFAAPTLADLESFVETMDARTGQRIHVHCAANYRVSAFYSLYAQRRGLCSEAEADQLVQDVWDPAAYPAWAEFIAQERARTLPE